MSEPTIPRKRVRIEAEGDSLAATEDANSSVEAGSAAHTMPDSSPRKRDEEFWFEDGNVILVACGVEFRIYRGVLADHSPVFKTMFSLPQPSSDEPSGCPEVELVDLPSDLRHVLRACMPKKYLSPFMPAEPSFDTISATIRLGHKYEMHELIEHSVAYLKSYYPRNFNIWESLNSYGPASWEYVDSIGVVNLARLTGEHSLLPTALSICCMLGSDIVEGLAHEDGTCEYLSREDLGRCFGAQKKLLVTHMASLARVFKTAPIAEGCITASACRRELRRALEDVDGYMVAWSERFLDTVLQTEPSACEDVKRVLCEKCWKELIKREDQERMDIWKRLPTIFDLDIPGWND